MVDGEVIPRPSYRLQYRLDNAVEASEQKADLARAARARTERYANGRSLSWKYDEAETRKALTERAITIDPTRLYSDFLAWVNDASITVLRDMTTGEKVMHLAPKRGNKAYAHKKRKLLNDLESQLSHMSLDRPFVPGRETLWHCQMLLITLTTDHKLMSLQDSWQHISKDIAQFKVLLKRAIGAKSIDSICVKEGTSSGYPAPHLLVIFNAPVTCRRRYSAFAKKYLYRVNSEPMYKAIQSCWKRGFIDVQGVVNNQVLDGKMKVSAASYIFKYLTKAIDVTNDDSSKKNLGVSTFAWQKLFRLRPVHVCKHLKTLVAARLDSLLHQSQQPKTGIWKYDSSVYCPLTEYLIILSQPPPPDPRPWPNIGASRMKPSLAPIANS